MCGMHKRIGNFQIYLSYPGTPFSNSSKSDGFFSACVKLEHMKLPFFVCGPNGQISAVFMVQPKHTDFKRYVLNTF